MNLESIIEPELEFGTGKHIDIRFGLMLHKPFDFSEPHAPNSIRLGIVGTNETIEGISKWLEKCRKGVAAKKSRQPNLFPHFAGFGVDTCLPAPLIFSSQAQRAISSSVFEKISKLEDLNQAIQEAVNLFMEEIEYLSQNSPVDVVICALPSNFLDYVEQKKSEKPFSTFIDFHDLLKAKAMQINTHTQLVRPSTYDESKLGRQKKRPDRVRKIQDEATRAWNFYTALYYKAKGTPWRLIRDSSQFTTCFVGISFYRTLDMDSLSTSIAQVFNERGDGIIVRGGTARISKEDRQPHLASEDAQHLLYSALEAYRKEHKTLPARLVLHKSSNYNEDELVGFRKAIEEQKLGTYDFLTVGRTKFRLLRNAEYPPLRGTFITLEQQKHVLYTIGSIDFYCTYPGLYAPNPIEIRCFDIEQTPSYLAQEILGLSKMNWNKTQFDNTEPITLLAARQVGSVLRYVGDNDLIQPRYSFFM